MIFLLGELCRRATSISSLAAAALLRALGRAPTMAFLTVFLLLPLAALGDVDRRTLNDGNLVLEDINALNEGHGYRKRANRDAYQQAMILFFQEHLVVTD